MLQPSIDTASVKDRVIVAVAAACNLEVAAVTLGTRLGEIGMDSMAIVTLAAHIEDTYECELLSHHIIELMTAARVSDVIAVVERIAGEVASVTAQCSG